tara:strand:+ start:320 stop:1189 length:870 start_codon:yes stop_codon:yes gene_type:complete
LTKIISIIIYKLIELSDKFFYLLTKKNFKLYLIDLLEKESYKKINILGKKIYFFVPNALVNTRVNNIFTDEPETINWINNFDKNDKINFWDIGANIGLYSIYASQKFNNIEITSFEPIPGNLKILSRNISINNLQNKIKISQFPLSDKENQYLKMVESDFLYGSALNVFGEETDYEGKRINSKNNYKIFGTTINFILKNNILECPNYVKIDVDGIEHLILSSGDELLKNKNLNSILIEINENFSLQHETVLHIMEKNNLKLVEKKQNNPDQLPNKFKKTYNYIFNKIKK